jgi:hypothetical protein
MRRIMQEEMEEFDKRMRQGELQREREDWERRNPQGFPFPRKQKPGQPLLPPLPPRSDGKSNFVSPRNKDVFKIMKYFRF